jgi:hypothetical protein
MNASFPFATMLKSFMMYATWLRPASTLPRLTRQSSTAVFPVMIVDLIANVDGSLYNCMAFLTRQL